jgi:hypothetical protein
MRKRRFIWVGLGLIALATVWFAVLRPRDEPKYEGRYLSEWCEAYEAAFKRKNSAAYAVWSLQKSSNNIYISKPTEQRTATTLNYATVDAAPGAVVASFGSGIGLTYDSKPTEQKTATTLPYPTVSAALGAEVVSLLVGTPVAGPIYTPDPVALAEFRQAEHALRAIGTKGLPCYLEWIRGPAPWQLTLRRRLPGWLQDKQWVKDWLDAARRRSRYADVGFRILGTNGVSAIPALEAFLLNGSTNIPKGSTIRALGCLGEAALPALQAEFAKTNSPYRRHVTVAVSDIAIKFGPNNTTRTILDAALSDDDRLVRHIAQENQRVMRSRSNAP